MFNNIILVGVMFTWFKIVYAYYQRPKDSPPCITTYKLKVKEPRYTDVYKDIFIKRDPWTFNNTSSMIKHPVFESIVEL